MTAFVAERKAVKQGSADPQTFAVTGCTQGNHLILALALNNNAARNLVSVTDDDAGGGSAWQIDVAHTGTTALNGLYICSKLIGSDSDFTVSCDMNSAVAVGIKCGEFSGLHQTTWFDTGTSAQNSASSTTSILTPTLSPGASGRLIFAAYGGPIQQTSNPTPDSNYTLMGNTLNVAGAETFVQYRLVGTTSETPGGTAAVSMTSPTWDAIAAYIPAPASSGQRPWNPIVSREAVNRSSRW